MSMQEKIYLNAEANIDETAWAKDNKREAKRNPNVCFNKGENKCNLFVYEIILASGYDIGTPNSINGIAHPILAAQGKLSRPPCAIDWYNGTVPGMTFIGEGNNSNGYASNTSCMPGDILTDGIHMAIVYKNKTTIGAGEKTVNKTGFGFDFIYGNSVKVFRCNK